MKRLMAIAALALAPLGCVANQGDAPIRFIQARALDYEEGQGCTGSDEFVISEGSLDISGGQGYLLAVNVETNTFQQPITIGQEPFSGGGLGDITLNEIIYSYEFQPVLGSAEVSLTLPADDEDRVAYYGVFRPETDPEETYTFVRAIGPQGLAALWRALHNDPAGTPDDFSDDTPKANAAVTVLSTIRARGKLSGGQTVETNRFTFPVTVYATGLTYCPTGQVPAGTCFIPGQDVPGCITPDA